MFLCSAAVAQSNPQPFLVHIKPVGDQVGVTLHHQIYLATCKDSRVILKLEKDKKTLSSAYINYNISTQKFTLHDRRPAYDANQLLIYCAHRDLSFSAGEHLKLVANTSLDDPGSQKP